MITILIFNMTAQYLYGRDSSIFEFMSTRQMQIACNPIVFPCSRYLSVNICCGDKFAIFIYIPPIL